MREHALASLHPSRPVEEPARGRPAQAQRGRRRVEARRHAGQAVSPKRAVGRVRPDHRQIGHAVASLKAAHAIPELIDFPDDIISPALRRATIRARPDPCAREQTGKAFLDAGAN
jgi:hypothetical protein